MPLQKIIVLCDGNTEFEVDAYMVGQLAVHRSTNADAWTVTHVESGLWVSAFTKLHAAVSFARELDKLVDLKPFVDVAFMRRKPTAKEKRLFAKIGQLRRQYGCYTGEGAIPVQIYNRAIK